MPILFQNLRARVVITVFIRFRCQSQGVLPRGLISIRFAVRVLYSGPESQKGTGLCRRSSHRNMLDLGTWGTRVWIDASKGIPRCTRVVADYLKDNGVNKESKPQGLGKKGTDVDDFRRSLQGRQKTTSITRKARK
jgi:hypothetical protein